MVFGKDRGESKALLLSVHSRKRGYGKKKDRPAEPREVEDIFGDAASIQEMERWAGAENRGERKSKAETKGDIKENEKGQSRGVWKDECKQEAEVEGKRQ